jgi:hypothetical protein
MMIIHGGWRMGIDAFALTTLSDDELLRRVELLAEGERAATVELIAHLGELDARKLYLGQGCGSLFRYCTDVLRLSEDATFNRIEVARASRKFPVILQLLAEGSLSLSTARRLAAHLTVENHKHLLAEAKGRSKREVEALVAGISPRPDVPAVVRRLPGTRPVESADGAAVPSPVPVRSSPSPSGAPGPAEFGSPPVFPPALAPVAGQRPIDAQIPVSRPIVAPLSPGRYRIQFTVGSDTHGKLRRAQDLLRREIPDGDPGAIFDRALTLLLHDIERRKLGATSRARTGPTGDLHSRHVPRTLRRAVWERDGGQCAFIARNGRRCGQRAYLEFHHLHPYALGGETSARNLSLRCRSHNAYEASFDFGRVLPMNECADDRREPERNLRGMRSSRPGTS